MSDPPFEFDVFAFTASNGDGTLASEPKNVLGEATDLWGTKWNKPEFLMNAPRIRTALRSAEYDILHVLVMDTIVLPTVLSLRPDTPVVLGPDIAGWSPIREGMFAEESGIQWGKNRFKFALKNTLARLAPYDEVIAFSKHHQNILNTFGIASEDVGIIHGGVAKRFTPQDDQRVQTDPPEVLYVGDFSAHKGYFLFLEALSRLDSQVSARLIGAGDPHRDRIRELGLMDNVTIEGFVPRGELPEYYRQADLHVVPSIDETAGPNTQLEALASGTPVVLTDKSGINEYAPEDVVVPFSPRTASALASAFETALASLDSLTKTAQKRHAEFSADKTLDDLAGIYQGVVERN